MNLNFPLEGNKSSRWNKFILYLLKWVGSYLMSKYFLLKVKFELEWNLANDSRVINIEIWSSSQIGKRFGHQFQYYRKNKKKQKKKEKKKIQTQPKTRKPHKSFRRVNQTFSEFNFYRIKLRVTLNLTRPVLCSPLLISLGHDMTQSLEVSGSIYHIINLWEKWNNMAKG